MTVKWIGAILVVVGCGGFGFSLAASYRREERSLTKLAQSLQWMECELQYRVTPLPQLFTEAAGQCDGVLSRLFSAMASELESQISPDAVSCMEAALVKVPQLPQSTEDLLRRLGSSLGRFDLQGQLEQLKAVQTACEDALEQHRLQRDSRVRNYQTLGLCAGAALAILFL